MALQHDTSPWASKSQIGAGFQLGIMMSNMQNEFEAMNRRLDVIAMDGRPTGVDI